MEIKRTQPGAANWTQTNGTTPAGKPAEAATELGATAGSPAFDSIRADFRRADLGTSRWNSILARSIDALLDSAEGSMGGLPVGAREKLSSMLAADPLFAKRVMSYWDQNLN